MKVRRYTHGNTVRLPLFDPRLEDNLSLFFTQVAKELVRFKGDITTLKFFTAVDRNRQCIEYTYEFKVELQ